MDYACFCYNCDKTFPHKEEEMSLNIGDKVIPIKVEEPVTICPYCGHNNVKSSFDTNL